MNRTAIETTIQFIKDNPNCLEKKDLITVNGAYSMRKVTVLTDGKKIRTNNIRATLGTWIVILNETAELRKVKSLNYRLEQILGVNWVIAQYLNDFSYWPQYFQRLDLDHSAIELLETALRYGNFEFMKNA